MTQWLGTKTLVVFDWNGTLYNARAAAEHTKGNGIAPLFDGVIEVLDYLSQQGLLLGIATAESRPVLMQQLQHHGIAQWFSAIRTASEGLSKPHPQMLWDVMEQVGATAQQTVMVGDTVRDLQLAANAGVDALAATYGLQTRTELALYPSVGFIDTVLQLKEVYFSLKHR